MLCVHRHDLWVGVYISHMQGLAIWMVAGLCLMRCESWLLQACNTEHDDWRVFRPWCAGMAAKAVDLLS